MFTGIFMGADHWIDLGGTRFPREPSPPASPVKTTKSKARQTVCFANMILIDTESVRVRVDLKLSSVQNGHYSVNALA